MHLLSFAPLEVKSEIPRVVMTVREEVLIEQHTGLFSYETKCIRVRTRAGLMTVTGENLVIAYFGVQDMLIRGRVDGVRLDGESL